MKRFNETSFRDSETLQERTKNRKYNTTRTLTILGDKFQRENAR